MIRRLWAARIPHSPHSSSTVGAQKPRSDRGGLKSPQDLGAGSQARRPTANLGSLGLTQPNSPPGVRVGDIHTPQGPAKRRAPSHPQPQQGAGWMRPPPTPPGPGTIPGPPAAKPNFPGSWAPAPTRHQQVRGGPQHHRPPARLPQPGRGCGEQRRGEAAGRRLGAARRQGRQRGPHPRAAQPPHQRGAGHGGGRSAPRTPGRTPGRTPPTQRPCLPSGRGEQPLGGSFSPGRGGASGVILSFPARLHPSHHPPPAAGRSPGRARLFLLLLLPGDAANAPKGAPPRLAHPARPSSGRGKDGGERAGRGHSPQPPSSPPRPSPKEPPSPQPPPGWGSTTPGAAHGAAATPGTTAPSIPASPPPEPPVAPAPVPAAASPGPPPAAAPLRSAAAPAATGPEQQQQHRAPSPWGCVWGGHRSPGSGCRAPRPAPPWNTGAPRGRSPPAPGAAEPRAAAATAPAAWREEEGKKNQNTRIKKKYLLLKNGCT